MIHTHGGLSANAAMTRLSKNCHQILCRPKKIIINWRRHCCSLYTARILWPWSFLPLYLRETKIWEFRVPWDVQPQRLGLTVRTTFLSVLIGNSVIILFKLCSLRWTVYSVHAFKTLVQSWSLCFVCHIKGEGPKLLSDENVWLFLTIEARQSVFYSRRECLSGADLRKPAYLRKHVNCDNVVIHTW